MSESVYRYYDAIGQLIYVGMTGRGVVRQREHGRDSGFWPYVANQQVDHHHTRAEALKAEADLIKAHRPPFNKVHNSDWPRGRDAYLDQAVSLGVRPDPAVMLAERIEFRLPIQVLAGSMLRIDRSFLAIAKRLVEPKGAPLVDAQGKRIGSLWRVPGSDVIFETTMLHHDSPLPCAYLAHLHPISGPGGTRFVLDPVEASFVWPAHWSNGDAKSGKGAC